MRRETCKHLFDVVAAIKEIDAYTRGIGYAVFFNQSITQAAVERKFEIIGEALHRLQREMQLYFHRSQVRNGLSVSEIFWRMAMM